MDAMCVAKKTSLWSRASSLDAVIYKSTRGPADFMTRIEEEGSESDSNECKSSIAERQESFGLCSYTKGKRLPHTKGKRLPHTSGRRLPSRNVGEVDDGDEITVEGSPVWQIGKPVKETSLDTYGSDDVMSSKSLSSFLTDDMNDMPEIPGSFCGSDYGWTSEDEDEDDKEYSPEKTSTINPTESEILTSEIFQLLENAHHGEIHTDRIGKYAEESKVDYLEELFKTFMPTPTFQSYQQAFCDHKITENELQWIDDEALRAFGVESQVHRMMIMQRIEEFIDGRDVLSSLSIENEVHRKILLQHIVEDVYSDHGILNHDDEEEELEDADSLDSNLMEEDELSDASSEEFYLHNQPPNVLFVNANAV